MNCAGENRSSRRLLRVRSTITDKRASSSRPELGSVFILNEVINQNDVVVMSYSPIVLYKRRLETLAGGLSHSRGLTTLLDWPQK